MIYTHSITSKGQITIPKEFRDQLKLGDKATIRLTTEGRIEIDKPKAPPTIEEIRATLGKPGKKPKLSEREKVFVPYLVDKYRPDAH